MLTGTDKLLESGCGVEKKEKLCRSRGGESCAFDGAMIVLQPIADTAHLVHGPIACCGNTWEGRGTLSSQGELYKLGFTTDIDEIDIVYGSETRLFNAIVQTYRSVHPKAIFVYSTCVSGLIGEDLDAICRKAEDACGIRVIPVNAPGFVGPKNLGNRIAGEVLLDSVIGTGEPPDNLSARGGFINLIGEYNIAGDLWLIEPVLRKAGVRIMSRITGDATFEEITYAHSADLNVVVCSRALVNVAKEMEKKYGIPYVEVSFFGKTEMAKALRGIGSGFSRSNSSGRSSRLNAWSDFDLAQKIDKVIESEETGLGEKLKKYAHLRGMKAVLYTGGVKSWSFISALQDLGIEIVAVGTKKSTVEDEEKMKAILGKDAPLIEDVTPANLRKLMKERAADMLVAGGRNLYLAMKEGFPFVDVNQERHIAYAGYDGLVNLAEQISNSVRFFNGKEVCGSEISGQTVSVPLKTRSDRDVLINPLKHSQSIGAAIALQGIDRTLPVIHGAQGCNFLAKVLITKHFREPIALMSTKLFTEDVVMGSEENLTTVVEGVIEKQQPDLIGVLTTGLSEVKGDDVAGTIKKWKMENGKRQIVYVSTPDYEGGLETGYAKAVEAVIESVVGRRKAEGRRLEAEVKDLAGFPDAGRLSGNYKVNVLVGSHLTPADFTELREMIESFGLTPVILPDLSALDGSRQEFSTLSSGGTKMSEIETMGSAGFTIAIGMSMEGPARLLKESFGIEYTMFESIYGLQGVDAFMETLSALSGRQVPPKYERQRRVLIDGMRDAHFYFGSKRVCMALEADLSVQVSRVLSEMGAEVGLSVVPSRTESAGRIYAGNVLVGDFFSIDGDFDLLIAGSHGADTAKRLGVPLYQTGFPVYKVLGNNSRIAIGYRGTLVMINEMANLLFQDDL
ncbi:MAG: nitrogenase iron-molybdenum cofactor biosynthesis protein NifE [Nitrospirota bacterium]|nr:nitrogenase iron-molybdenum cofactor biosynthesis protein NifE [Nitrospirota bacterium]